MGGWHIMAWQGILICNCQAFGPQVIDAILGLIRFDGRVVCVDYAAA